MTPRTSPLEHVEQAQVITWARIVGGMMPETGLDMLFATVNGAHLAGDDRMRAIQIKRLKATGMITGIPDLWLPVARQGYHALAIELKRVDGRAHKDGGPRENQIACADRLTQLGNLSIVCYGHQEAIAEICAYLQIENPVMFW